MSEDQIVKIRLLEDIEIGNKGEIIEVEKKLGKTAVNGGFANYLTESEEDKEKQNLIFEEENNDEHDSFIDFFVKYISKRTSADRKYALHMGLQLLGIVVGVDTVHNIQPKPIHHNLFTALIGPSTTAKKTTVQDLSMDLVSEEKKLPRDFSPEGFLKDLEKTPQGVAPLGEWSSILRSVKNGGYMSKFKEIQNELHGCPKFYSRRLSKKKDSVTIQDPYLNLNTTCTPEEFFTNLDDNLLYGGTLARWILVDGKAIYKPREKLAPDVEKEERLIRKTLRNLEGIFTFKNPVRGSPKIPWVQFEFTKKGLEEFNKIDNDLMHNGEWADIQPFVGRYLNYLIVYADLLLLSDIIGAIGLEKFPSVLELNDLIDDEKQLHYFNNLNNLYYFNNFTLDNSITSNSSPNSSPKENHAGERGYVVEVVKLLKLSQKPNIQQKCHHFTIYVSEVYVQRAFEILLPCLKFAKQVTKYVNEDMKIARIKTVLERHAPFDRSNTLRFSKLTKKDFDEAIDTLIEREEVFQIIVENEKYAQAPDKTIYCLEENRDSKKCKNCKYKDFLWANKSTAEILEQKSGGD